MKERLLCRLILTGILTVLLTGCRTNTDEEINDSESEKREKSTAGKQITWAMPLNYFERTNLDENAAYLNKLLAAEGYAYELSFLPLESEDYENIISSGRTKDIDILSLGLTASKTIGTPQRLLEAGILYDLSDYLHSPEGNGLYSAFYEKLWDSLTIDGKNCVIPNQYGQDGIGYAAFRREIFGDDIQWDGTVEGLFGLAEQAEIPENMIPILWGEELLHISVGMGYEYYRGFFVSLKEGRFQFPYQTESLQDAYSLMNEWYLSGRLQSLSNTERRKEMIEEKNYAIWVDYNWSNIREKAADEYVFVQMPFVFSTRISAGIGICESSSNKAAALELLTLLFTQEQYANALIWGEPGVKFELKDNYAVSPEEDQQTFVFTETLMTGIFDLVYPCEFDDFPVNRIETKWNLYGTEAERMSPISGKLPDISAIQSEIVKIEELAAEYEYIWQEEDMAAAWDEVNRKYEEMGGKKIAAELERLFGLKQCPPAEIQE